MKNIKKILLAAVVMMFVMILPCNAETREAYNDNFDRFTEDANMGYTGNTLTNSSDVFAADTACANGTIVAGGGIDGKAAIKLSANLLYDNIRLRTEKLDTASGDSVVFGYDFCISDFGNLPEKFTQTRLADSFLKNDRILMIMYLADGSRGAGVYFTDETRAELALCEEGVWYQLTVLQTETEKKAWIRLGDGTLIASNSIVQTMDEGAEFAIHMPGYSGATGVTERSSLLIDNAVLSRYNAADSAECITATVAPDETNVRRNKVLEFTFDQQITGAVSLLKNGQQVNGTTATQTAFNKLLISYEGLLERKTVYTLSFSTVRNDGEVECITEDYTFTTEDYHILNDINLKSALTGTDGKTSVTFEIDDPLEYPVYTGVLFAAKYNGGQMKETDMIMLSDQSITSEITKEFSLGEFTSGDSLQLFLFDIANSPVPLSASNLINW